MQDAPNYRDLPLGLGISLAQDLEAMSNFGAMDREVQKRIIDYVQGGLTGEDAHRRVQEAVEHIKAGDIYMWL